MTQSYRPSLTLPQHIAATLTLGLPLVGSYVAQMAVGITDTVMLGWYSVGALASSVLAGTLFFVVFILGTGFANAVLPKVAAAQGDTQRVRRITRMGLWIGAGFAVAVYPLFFFSGPVLLALGQDPDVAAGAQLYLRISGLGMLPAMIVSGLRSHLAGLERTGIVLMATLMGAAVNAVLNWVLIFGNLGAPEMGLEGAAWASLSVHTVMGIVLSIYALRGRGMAQYQLFVRIWRPDWPEFREIIALGWPISLTLLAESGLFAASGLMIGWLGPVPLAAHGIALQITSVTFMVHLGLSSAATVRAGSAFARSDGAELRRVAQAAFLLSAGAVIVTVAAFLGIPGLLVAGFIDASDPAFPAIYTMGVTLLAVAALFQVVDAAQVMALGLLRGLQDTRVPMLFAGFGYWVVGIPASYVIGFKMGYGPQGVWLGLVIGLTLAGSLMMWRFLHSPVLRQRPPAV